MHCRRCILTARCDKVYRPGVWCPVTFTWPCQQQSTLPAHSIATSSATRLSYIVGAIRLEGRLPPPSFQEPTQNAVRTVCVFVSRTTRHTQPILGLSMNLLACLWYGVGNAFERPGEWRHGILKYVMVMPSIVTRLRSSWSAIASQLSFSLLVLKSFRRAEVR